MTLSPEHAAFVEAKPYAFTSHITDDMQERIGKRMKAQAMAEGHRPLMPIARQPDHGKQKPERASITDCVGAMLPQRKEWRFSELRAETGLHHNKLQYALETLMAKGAAQRRRENGERYIYWAVKA